ncbi:MULTISPECIES: SH3 domain-containing C40 family peptidase [unclassified Polaribacter]|uniref:SH3 domain-containing C40 family peptidase n=1 Tax=unclassified Polaribacter TaxID=196858 RepID=UPI0011BFC7E0|nr:MULTISPECIES: SH3 domain-containing C40 family peptidase [unclassified Polaribacter]TXD54365.1 NlpC/P60 family protein [Polaribacter sp. IC063]TXD62804.1 NlpC/P60 family protein [Polaribacter sp. IC066]
MKILKYFSVLLLLVFMSCKNDSKTISEIERIHSSIKKDFAPDKRVELFDIQFSTSNEKFILTGETTSKEAYMLLLDSLNDRKLTFVNKVRMLPDSAVGKQQYAVARNSVINIRSKPKHSAELGTQGLLGMSLKILDKKGDFYRIQTPDNYISWVDKGGITKMTKDTFDRWNASKKIIFTKNFGYVYVDASEDSQIVSDITLGGLLHYISEDNQFYKVKYPDNRTGFIKKEEGIMYSSWLQNFVTSKENIETVAKKMEGFPYLWGGTSSKGMDCSGFTKMVYLMNGFVIPRDASQQINAGKTVDTNLDFSDLQKGDLLFFGTKAEENKKQKVVHVGIWLGNNKMEFIHASGNVHLSSMDKNETNFDAMNKNRYLGSKRYLGVKDKNIVDLKKKIKL